MLIKVQKRMESGIQTRELQPAGTHSGVSQWDKVDGTVEAPLLPPADLEEGTVKD